VAAGGPHATTSADHAARRGPRDMHNMPPCPSRCCATAGPRARERKGESRERGREWRWRHAMLWGGRAAMGEGGVGVSEALENLYIYSEPSTGLSWAF